MSWHIGTNDSTTFLALNELLHTSNPDDPGWVIDLLRGSAKQAGAKSL
jgi:hypothetical protein